MSEVIGIPLNVKAHEALKTLSHYAQCYLNERKDDLHCGMTSMTEEDLKDLEQDLEEAERTLKKTIRKPARKKHR